MCFALALSLIASTPECLTWPQMLAYLGRYGQVPTQAGLTERSNTMTAFVNPDMDTWTIVRLTPLGCATIWANGIGWKWLSSGRRGE